LAVGVAAALATKYFTSQSLAGLPSAVPLIVLVVALLIVPVRKLPRGQVRLRPIATERRRATPVRSGVLAALVVGGLVVVPHVVGTKLPVWTNALTQAVIFGSLALLVWTSGQISLCHASFVALGATNMAHLQDDGLPWLAALFLAGLLTVPVGALIAIPAIRLSGIYLALVTLGFGVVMQVVVFNSWLMFGSSQKVTGSRPEFGPFDGSDKSTYYAALCVVVAVFGFLAALERARLGRLLRAMSESPTLLSTSGLGVNLTRLLVFCISAFLAGIGGGLALTQFGSISGVGYGPLQSLLFVAILALGGTGLITSSIIAALLSGVLPGYVTEFGVNEQLTAFGAAALIAGLLIGARPEIATWTRAQAARAAWRRLRSPVTARGPAPRGVRPKLGLEAGAQQ
jgi:ABC-type branched-subunit amino acid transport system permease subunit